jgi:hypothetical protein
MDVIWKKKENEVKENQNKGINELKEGLKIKTNNLILEKKKLISSKPNFLKQLSFNNNTNIITQKKPNLTIILPEENNNKTLNNYKNNLLNQTIQSNNPLLYRSGNVYTNFNPNFSLPLTASLSTKTDSNISESNWQSIKMYNNINEIMSPIGRIPSNLFTPTFQNTINFPSVKTFPKSTKNSNNSLNKFSKSGVINNNLIKNNNINFQTMEIKENKDNSKYSIKIEDIINGKDKRTSVRIMNIPIKYTVDDLIKKIDLTMGFNDETFFRNYDLFYLPMSKNNPKNLGYAFINFIHPLCIIDFYNKIKGLKWKNEHKECQISYAKFQGKEELIEHLLETSGDEKKISLFEVNLEKIKFIIPFQYKNDIELRNDINNEVEYI